MDPLRVLREPRGVALALATALLVPMLATATSPIDDPDVFLIATVGRDWIARGRLPRENFYSFTDPSHPWITHEWLPAAFYAYGLGHFGPAFFALFALSVLAATYAVAFRATLSPRNLAASALLSLLTLTFAKRLLSARPLATSLLLAVSVAELAYGKRFGPRRAAACVGLVWLWTNVHGSFPLGVALLVGGAADAWWRGEREARVLRARALAIVGSGVATFVNPYGARVHTFVFHHLVGDSGGAFSASHDLVTEFAPIWRDRSVVGPTELAGGALVLVLALFALRKKEHAARAAFVLALAALAAMQVRHLEQLGLVGAVLLAPCVDATWPPSPVAPAALHVRVRRAVVPPLLVAAVAFVVVAARRTRDEWLGDWVGGSAVAELARALPEGARVHAPYASDGLVLWLAAPRGVRVFFDPRADGYAPEVARAGIEIADGLEDAAPLLRRYGASHVIARGDGPLRARLEASWRETGRSGGWVLLESAGH